METYNVYESGDYLYLLADLRLSQSWRCRGPRLNIFRFVVEHIFFYVCCRAPKMCFSSGTRNVSNGL